MNFTWLRRVTPAKGLSVSQIRPSAPQKHPSPPHGWLPSFALEPEREHPTRESTSGGSVCPSNGPGRLWKSRAAGG